MKILIVEDEPELAGALNYFLTKETYTCESAPTFGEADEKVCIYEYDMILLDIGLPDGNGIELLNLIQKHQKNAGVIIISAKDSLDDKLTGLDLGADDYLTKPFQLSELNSRIKAVLRRRQFDGNNVITFNEISIDTGAKSVTVNGRPIILTGKEYNLILYFLVNKNRVITKESIVEHLWNDNVDLVDSLDFVYTHVTNIRKKIKKAGGADYIKTIYGMGYKFTDQ